MENQKVTILVLIDLSAAFDTVDHELLLNILDSQYGIKGSALNWITSYLKNRKQKVCIGDSLSSESDLKYGVPQGSCIGPLLFSLYANSLHALADKHSTQIHGYADDHQLYVSFSPNNQMNQHDAVRNN